MITQKRLNLYYNESVVNCFDYQGLTMTGCSLTRCWTKACVELQSLQLKSSHIFDINYSSKISSMWHVVCCSCLPVPFLLHSLAFFFYCEEIPFQYTFMEKGVITTHAPTRFVIVVEESLAISAFLQKILQVLWLSIYMIHLFISTKCTTRKQELHIFIGKTKRPIQVVVEK